LNLARSDYVNQNVDYPTLVSASWELLQIQLQIAQVEAELGKALASLEPAVGSQINEHPPARVERKST
jgi:outer membrane protein, heavy metal efflux system